MFRLICVRYYCGGLFWDKFYAYRLVDNNEYDGNIQMGEEIFITCTRNYEWVCALFIYWINCFSTSLVGNKTTLFVLGIIIFMLLGIRIGNTVFWNERKVDGWTGMLIPCMLAAIVTNIEHEYYQLHFGLLSF